MKIGIITCLLALTCFTGCAYRGNQTPITAADANQHPCQAVVETGVADGSKYVWDETKQAWTWMTSDEMKERARKYWQAAKESAVKAYDKTIESYNDRK